MAARPRPMDNAHCDKMHILVMPSWYRTKEKPYGGIFFHQQAQALDAHGYRVGLIYPDLRSLRRIAHHPLKSRVRISSDDDVITYRLTSWMWLPRVPYGALILFKQAFARLFELYRANCGLPDVIHAHAILYGGVAALAIGRKANIPVVVTEHSSTYGRGMIKRWEVPHVARVLDEADCVMAVGRGLAEELERFGVGRTIEVIPNLVDTDFFSCPPAGSKPRNKRFRWLSIGSLIPNKNYTLLLEAFAQSFRGQPVELQIGGSGEQLEELQALAARVGISGQVAFLGPLTKAEVREAMCKCDAFVLSSQYETFGVVLIEALACGKPIVATRCGGPEDIVMPLNGYLVEVDDTAALALALESMVRHINAFDATRIRQNCIERFGTDAVVSQLEAVYRRVVSGVRCGR